MQSFIQQLIANNGVYTLIYKDEFSFVGSNIFNLEDGSPVPVWCFWSNVDSANLNRQSDWKLYEPEFFPIANFIEDVLVQMANEGYIIGLEFNENLEGMEADPLDLLLEIIKQLKSANITVELDYFKDIDDLEKQARKFL